MVSGAGGSVLSLLVHKRLTEGVSYLVQQHCGYSSGVDGVD